MKGALDIQFPYGKHDAAYRLDGARLQEFDRVVRVLRNELAILGDRSVKDNTAEAVKTEAVANTFLEAVKTWPKANPSDLWWFVVFRLYCDPFNQPGALRALDSLFAK